MNTLRRFFDSINRIANSLAFPPPCEVVVTLSQEDRDLLREIRWHRVKKGVA